MAKKKELKTSEEVAPNLIPMVDIMFLLLLFFMLGADMGQRELEKVALPLATASQGGQGGPRTEDRPPHDQRLSPLRGRDPLRGLLEAGDLPRTTRTGGSGSRASDYTEPEKLIEAARGRRRTRIGTSRSGPKISERKVMVRADASSPYGYVQDVMHACAAVGIYKIECGAARPVEG